MPKKYSHQLVPLLIPKNHLQEQLVRLQFPLQMKGLLLQPVLQLPLLRMHEAESVNITTTPIPALFSLANTAPSKLIFIKSRGEGTHLVLFPLWRGKDWACPGDGTICGSKSFNSCSTRWRAGGVFWSRVLFLCDQMSHTVTANSFKKTFNFHLFMI